jgi:hypothetical protein
MIDEIGIALRSHCAFGFPGVSGPTFLDSTKLRSPAHGDVPAGS